MSVCLPLPARLKHEFANGQDSDYEFSRRSMLALWQAGSNDVHRTLRHPRLERADDESVGMLVFDLAGESNAS
jgi:hypothetical protein